jgi:hypothetical protein
MTIPLTWDPVGERFYETGIDQGVLYVPDANGAYNTGFSWNGLTSITESPTGAEATKQYADNKIYLTLTAVEEFGISLEAFTYPDEFDEFDGIYTPNPGVSVGQQSRKSFGLSYRTRVGNDLLNDELGYKIHMIYGCRATPSEKAYNTVNESPEAMPLSWEIMTTPAAVAGQKATSIITVDSTKVDSTNLAALEAILYGAAAVAPALPTPDEVLTILTP